MVVVSYANLCLSGALGIKSNVYTVSGLAENTLYLIRVTPGSGDQYETVYSQVVSVKTSVLRTFS